MAQDLDALAKQFGGAPTDISLSVSKSKDAPKVSDIEFDQIAKQFGGAPADPTGGAGASVTVDAKASDRSMTDTAIDVAKGVAKGAANTAYGLGKIVHDYTPIGRISDAIQPGAFEAQNKPPELTPTNTAQKAGYYGEQIGEFLLPTAEAGALAKAPGFANAPRLVQRALSGAQAAGITAAQGGGPVASTVSGALGAAIPGGAVASRASDALERSAQKEMAMALGATKEWAKSEAAKLAPQMLQRGIGGSRPAMLEVAKQTAKRVGGELDTAYRAAAAAGETVPSDIIAGNVQVARDALQTTNAAGKRVTIPGTEAVVDKLNQLSDFVQSLGLDIPVDKAAHVKRVWDQIVSKAGLFGPKATANATDNAQAWAVREASGSFRELLNSNPTIEALNKESSFWTGLKNVLKETQKRTQAQAGTGLVQAGSSGAGAIVGALSGDSPTDRASKAVVGGIAGRQLTKLVQSPAFRTMVSGPMKQTLADALASGSTGAILSAVQRISTSLPSQIRQQLSY